MELAGKTSDLGLNQPITNGSLGNSDIDSGNSGNSESGTTGRTKRQYNKRGSRNSGHSDAGLGAGAGADTETGNFEPDFIRGISSAKPKKVAQKKGFRPVLTPAQTDSLIDSTFGGAAIVIDDRWAIEPDEAKELSKCLYAVFECFPVKLEDNPLILQRIFAIFGLILAVITIFTSENRFRETLKGNNNGIIGRAKKKEVGSNGTTGAITENENASANLF